MKRFYSNFHLFLMSMIMLSGLVTTHAQFQCYDLSGCQDYSNYGVRSTGAADLEYDNIISSWHSTIARDIDGSLKIWGENSQSDGTSHHTTPTVISSSLYSGLTGTPLKAAIGSAHQNVQYILLTDDNKLWAWGSNFGGDYSPSNARAVLRNSVKNSDGFGQLGVGLPSGVNASDVKMMFATAGTLAITTCDGHVYVLSYNPRINQGGSDSNWVQIRKSSSSGDYLTGIVAARGSSAGMFALDASGNLWTWGYGTYLGDGTQKSDGRSFATQMTLPKNGGAIKMIGATNSLEAHNTTANNSYPRFGSNGQNSNSVSMSYYVLYEDGDLFSLGDNKWRQLGDWTTTERRSWVQPRYNSSSGPVMNDIAWISPQEHDYVWSFINVVNNDNKLINWGSESGNDLGRTVGSQGTGLEVHTDWNPGSPHKMDPDAVVITAESGGHTSVFIQECETDFGYIGHKINGSMGDGTIGGSTDDEVHLATAAIQICGAPSQLGDLNVSVTHEGGTYCADEVVTMIGSPSGGTFSIEDGSEIASIDGQSGELSFSGEGIVKVKYVIDLTEETCGEETHYYSLIVEECLPVVFDVSGTVYVDNDGVLNGVGGDPLGNVTVHLKDENDNIVATITTDSNGDYEFTEVENGNYTIEIENPGEYLNVSDTQGDSDDGKIEITVSGADHTGNDFGLNRKPVGEDVEDTYVQNEPKEIDLYDEISDPDGNEDVSTIGFEVPSGATCEGTDSDGRCIKVQVPGEGTWEVDEDGKVTFTPEEDYVGDAEIDYTVLDEAGLESDPKTIELKADVEPSISLVKSGVLSADGTSIEYTFTVINTGNVTLTNVVIDDAKLGLSGQLIDPSTLVPDQEGTYVATYTVTQADLNAGIVENTATTTGTPPVGNDVTAEDDEDTPLDQEASISLVKSGALDGDAITYTFTVQNTGNVTLTDVVVNDAMLSEDPIAVTPSTLEPGNSGTATATYTVTQADLNAGIVENIATTSGTPPIGDPVEDEDEEDVELPQEASISLVKSGALDGDVITYTFTVQNTGNVTLTDVVVNDAMLSEDPIAVTPSTLEPGNSGTATATYTVTQADLNAGIVENIATTTGTPPIGDPVEDEDEEDVELEQDPSIHLLKSGVYVDANEDGIVNPGDEIHYTFTVTNTGNVTLTDVVIHDDRIGVEDLFVTDELAPAAEMTVAFTYTITQNDINDGGVWNLAIVTGNDPDDEPVEDESEDPEPLEEDDPDYDPECPDCTFVPLEESPSIHLLKSGFYVDANEDGIVNPGDEIYYTFTVTNTGNVPLTDVTVTDPLVTVTGGPIDLDVGENDETTFTGVYVVTQADINAGGVYNIALVTGTSPDGEEVEDESEDPEPLDPDDPDYDPECPDCTFVPLEESPSIHLLKSGAYVDANEDGIVNPGDEIHYMFVVTNTGNVPLTDVTVTDPLVTVTGGPIDLDVGESDETTFTGVYVVTQADINAGGVYNIATTTGTPPNGDPVEDDSEDPNPLEEDDPDYDPECPDCTFVPLEESPSIHLLKSGAYVDANEDGIVNPGDEIHYTFVVTNTGNVPLTDVTVTDPLVSVSGGPIDLDVGESDGTTFTGVYVVTQADINAGGVYNIATTTGTPPKGDPVEDDSEDPEPLDPEDPNYDEDCPDCTFVPLEEDPSIHLLKSGVYVDANEDGIVNPGDEIHYTFTVTNTGNVPLTGVTVTDPLVTVGGGPIDLDVGQSDATEFTGVYTVTQADINAGGVYNIATTSGTPPKGDPVEDDSEDPEPLDPEDPNFDPECPDCTFVPLEEDPSIHLLKSGVYVDANEDGIVNPGDEIHYTFVVTNTGNVPLTGVTVTDPLVTVSGGPIGLDVGQSDETTFTGVYVVTQADINAGGVYNIATTTGTPPKGDPVEDDSEDPNPLDEDDPNYDPDCPDCTFTELDQDPSIELVKTAEEGDYGMGDEITYTFKVTNTGNVTLSNITIEDLLPGIVISGNESPITLDPEDSDDTHFTAIYTVSEDDIANRGVFNHATVTGEDPKGDEVNDDDEEEVVILVPPVAEDDEKEGGTPGNPITVEDITENDTPGNCGPLLTETIILFSPDGTVSGTSVQVAGEGTWTVDLSSGEVTFAPEQGFLDDPTPITYTVEDECEQLTGAIIRVMYDFEPPVAVDDFKDDQVPGNPVTLPIIDNDKKGNDGPLNPGTIDLIETVDETNVPSTCMTTDAEGRCIELDVPGEGTWTAHDDGSATFTPEFGFEDDPTPIKYTIEDEAGQLSNEATITILYDHEPVVTPNCGNTAPAIVSDCESVMIASDFVTNWDRDIYPLKIYVYDRWGLVIPGFPVTLYNSDQTFAIDVTAYLGERLEFSVENAAGRCNLGFLDVGNTAGLDVESAWQDDDSRPNVSKGKIVVYCGQVPDPSEHIPSVESACGYDWSDPKNQPDWNTHFDCGKSDTAEVILRSWEVVDSEGTRATITDTIIVMRLPKLMAESFLGEFKNHLYCELDGYTDSDEPMVEYASWKQPVGIADYELPVEKLGHVVYHIPGSIIHAGLANACAQGGEIEDAYLNQVIVKYADGNVVRIRDIIDGSYMSDIIASTTTTQKGYGILQAIYDGTMSPYNISLPCGSYTFFEYLLLPMGAEVMSESGSYERVGMDWFYNGSGNAPYWFSGGWPSLYGSGKCVSYCDASESHEFECISIVVPSLTKDGYDLENCDTICLVADGVDYCGLRVTQELSEWTGDCEQERVLETRVEQSCWADIEVACEGGDGEVGDDCLVAEYEDNEKCCGRINITLRQMQVMHDTLPPIFDFCYSTDWDQEGIKSAISNGEQPAEALAWERNNPTIYTTDLHDCSAEVFVPSVTVTDNCSGLQQMKAVFYNYDGGIKAVELELTSIDTVLMSDGRACVNYTYSHTGEGIRVPFQGCDDDELIEVVYEASDGCWNTSSWTKFIQIRDDVPPTAVADHDVNVTMTSTIEWASAERTYDEGSWDNCGVDLMLVRRADWSESGLIDLCVGDDYSSWSEILVAIGFASHEVDQAVSGQGVGSPMIDIDQLDKFFAGNEIENYYLRQIKKLWEEGDCRAQVVHGWLYGIAVHLAENCGSGELSETELSVIFDHLFDAFGYGYEISYIGGGWGAEAPFTCSDACESVETDLLVMDYCCNVSRVNTTTYVEDRSESRLQETLPDLAISCEAYNTLYHDIVADAENGSFDRLNDVFGEYIVSRLDSRGRPIDDLGELLSASELEFSYEDVSCQEVGSGSDKTTILDTVSYSGKHGIVGVSCGGRFTQTIEVKLDACGEGVITRRFFVETSCGEDSETREIQSQTIRIVPACPMRESMFDVAPRLGTVNDPICLPSELLEGELFDTIGALKVKDHLSGKLCNSISISHAVNRTVLTGYPDLVQYMITWTATDWCCAEELPEREYEFTQKVIARIDPECVLNGGGDGPRIVQGTVSTENGSVIEDVEMKAVLKNNSLMRITTEGDGAYLFSIPEGSDLSLIPEKNHGFSEGITTRDLILIQRHILGKETLDSRYQRIAADVNGDGSINAFDLLELRQLVLNPDGVLANNKSWRFYEKDSHREVYEITDLREDQRVDFVGVKIGDVDLSSDPASTSRRVTDALTLNVTDQVLRGGETYRVDVRSDNFEDIQGLQYTLSYADAYVSVESIEPGALRVTEDHYYRYGPGVVTSSWNDAEGVSLNSNEVLFTIVLKAKSAVQLRDALGVNSRVTSAEAYSGEALKSVDLRIGGGESSFALHQNVPNPYRDETVIGFELPESGSATLTIYDVKGQQIHRVEGEYGSGYNEVRVKSVELGATGVLYFQLDTDRHTATKKMVVVE